MKGLKKIATNIPADLMEEATQITGLNQTQTLVEGLRELIAKNKRQTLLNLAGKIKVSVDIETTRKRVRT